MTKQLYGIYIWRNGKIQIGQVCPLGALPVMHKLEKQVAENLVVAFCSLSRHDNSTYLYPPAVDNVNAVFQLEEKMKKHLAAGKANY